MKLRGIAIKENGDLFLVAYGSVRTYRVQAH